MTNKKTAPLTIAKIEEKLKFKVAHKLADAVRHKDIQWLINHLVELEFSDQENEYDRIVTLRVIEAYELWKLHPKHKDEDWPEFLRSTCRFTNIKYQRCKVMFDLHGPKIYKMFGANLLQVASKYQPNDKKVIDAMLAHVDEKGTIPSIGTVDRMGQSISGRHATPIVSEITGDNSDDWRDKYLAANKTLRSLRKENKQLRSENRDLKDRLKILSSRLRKTGIEVLAKLSQRRAK